MLQNEDIKAKIEVYFRQIMSICDLILENSPSEFNILTIRDLAENGLFSTNNLNLDD